MDQRNSRQSGFVMIEVIISVAIAVVLLGSFLTIAVHNARIARANQKEVKAALYARELIEIANDLERSNWNAFSASCQAPAVCKPQIVSGAWTLAVGSESLESAAYTRSISWQNVYRSSASFPNTIVANPGILDANTKLVTAKVTWNSGFVSRTIQLQTYVYNMQ